MNLIFSKLDKNPSAMEKFNTVLLIDDDPSSNYISEKLIKRLGLAENVTSVLNGLQALQYLNNSSDLPDLIFLDINMPLMNGYEFLEAFEMLTIDKSRINIVMLTSSGDGRDLDKVQSYGVRYYLSKPLMDNNLVKICEIIQLNIKLRFVMLNT
jgi:CheY-like chemotaxis protein